MLSGHEKPQCQIYVQNGTLFFDPFGTQPLPPVQFGAVQQRHFDAAAVALVGSRVQVMFNSGLHPAETAGKNDGFRRIRTCMVPSAPEAGMPQRWL